MTKPKWGTNSSTKDEPPKSKHWVRSASTKLWDVKSGPKSIVWVKGLGETASSIPAKTIRAQDCLIQYGFSFPGGGL